MPDSDLSARGALRLASSSAAFLVVFLLAGLILPAGAAFAVSNPALQIDTTSEPDSSDAEDGSTGSARAVFIGEVVTFALTFDVAEGTTAGVSAEVSLPDGLQYIAGSESVTVTNDAGWTESATVTGGGASGADVSFDFGTVDNTDSDPGVETIRIDFDVVVSNIAANQSGTVLTTSATLNAGGSAVGTSESRALIIRTPNLSVDKQQRGTFNGPGITTGDAGDSIFYRIFITNNGDAPAYDVNVLDSLPLDFVDVTSCCTTTGTTTGAAVTANPSPGPFGFYWAEIDPGVTVSVSLEMTVSDSTAPGESWSNTAVISFSSLPGTNGTGSATPGAPGTDSGERNDADGVGGAVDDFEVSATSPTFTVPEPDIVKHIEHPGVTPVAAFFGGTYSDSTDDPNTGMSEWAAGNVDLAIGEEFSYIITMTLPEGTTYDLINIDLLSPVGHTGGRQNRVIEMLSAEVIHVGGNLSGGGVAPVGTLFTVVDSNGDGDGTRSQLLVGGSRDVFNTPDGVLDDDDRYVIRINARVDDEDESGGVADALVNVTNRDGDIGGNRLQYQWNDQSNNTTVRNLVAELDMVEPDVQIGKLTNTTTPVGSGDTVRFTLTIANAGTAPAYDVLINDVYPTEAGAEVILFDAIDAATSTCDDLAGFGVTFPSPGETRFAFDELLAGTNCTIVSDTTAQSAIQDGVTYSNTASVLEYSSRAMPSDADVRDYVGGSTTSTFEGPDVTSPLVSEVVAVTTPTTDTTPNVTVATDEGGTLTVRGSCGSLDEGAVVFGNTTITLTQIDNATPLVDGTYADCTVTVTDASANPSNVLTLSAFTVDTTPPMVAETTPVASPTNDTTPEVTISTNESGTLAVGGSCGSPAEGPIGTGTTIIALTQPDNSTPLAEGAYSDCTVAVSDALGNTSPLVLLTAFTVDTTAPAFSSIVRQTPADEVTNADTLTFRATFDGDVENVDAADFAVSGSTATVTAVTPVTGSSVFDLTVSGGDLAGLDGTVGLDLAGGQDIADGAGNALPAGEPVTDETYTLDNDAPSVTIASLTTVDASPPLTGMIDDDQATLEVTVGGQTVMAANNGDGTWSLADDALAPLANGTYDVVVTATDPAGNEGSDATVDELTITPDTDGDGVDDSVENAGPNGGDANDDSIPDSDQPGVATLLTATGRGYMTVSVAGACIRLQQVAAVDPATLPSDPAGSPYPFGLVEFQLPCESASVEVVYHGADSVDFLTSTYRKYGPVTPGDAATVDWYDFSDFATLDGNTWTLDLADDRLGDDTGDDGLIVDQCGPASGPALPIPVDRPLALLMLMLASLALGHRHLSRRNTRGNRPGTA